MISKPDLLHKFPEGKDFQRSLKKAEQGIWQRRFGEYVIRDEGDYERHIDTSTTIP